MAKSKFRTPQRGKRSDSIGDSFVTPPRIINPHEMSVDALMQTDLYKDFQKEGGSLLYGLKKERMPYLDVLRARIGESKPVTADHVNQAVIDTLFGFNGTPLKRARTNIKKMYREYYDAMVACPDPKVRVNRNDFPENDKLRTDKASRLIRRGCKALLHRIKEHASTARNRIIHFCLDGIDLRQVFDRSDSIFYTSHTSAELRYIKKHWERLKGHILFYRAGKRISTPDCIVRNRTDDQSTKKRRGALSELIPPSKRRKTTSSANRKVNFNRKLAGKDSYSKQELNGRTSQEVSLKAKNEETKQPSLPFVKVLSFASLGLVSKAASVVETASADKLVR